MMHTGFQSPTSRVHVSLIKPTLRNANDFTRFAWLHSGLSLGVYLIN